MIGLSSTTKARRPLGAGPDAPGAALFGAMTVCSTTVGLSFKVTMKVAPCPTTLTQVKVPPSSVTMRWLMVSPRPVRCPNGLVV